MSAAAVVEFAAAADDSAAAAGAEAAGAVGEAATALDFAGADDGASDVVADEQAATLSPAVRSATE